MKSHLLTLGTLAVLASTSSAQILSNGTGGGNWTTGGTWALGNVPPTTGSFGIQVGDTVTANNAGVIMNNTNADPFVYGTLDLGTGTSLTGRRLNNGMTSNGIININGGSLSVARYSAAGGTGTVNLNSGSFTVRDGVAITAGLLTTNVSGGIAATLPVVAPLAP